MALTYLQFHAVFLAPPLAALAVAAYWRRERVDWLVTGVGVAVVTALAVVYTTPWDGSLIERGVWWYGDGRVAARVWSIPVEELLFFVLQPLLTALWTVQVVGPVVEGVRHTWRDRAVGAGAGLAVGLVGLVCLTSSATFYLGAILAWAGPVLALQWAVGWRYLLSTRRRVAIAVFVPSAYLWVADWVAIDAGVWTIADAYSTGLAVAGLPIEEMVFFLVTNAFVVQGLVLLYWVVHRLRARDPSESGTGLAGERDGGFTGERGGGLASDRGDRPTSEGDGQPAVETDEPPVTEP
jgi:lycopene cyclase domain-containing protein